MKRITLLFAFMAAFALTIHAQYSSNSLTGTGQDGYGYMDGVSGGGTDVFIASTSPVDDALSSAQTIPFSWEFYGSTVTSYKVSDNGYITFDGSASTSYPSNTSIPNASGPNNAIYAFWDDLEIATGSGAVDRVNTWTYGDSPNRVHVIEWYSVTPKSGTATFMYAAVRLYECGDFDIVIPWANGTGMSATVGCENSAGSAATMAAGPSYDYPSGLTDAGSDDVVYHFAATGTSYDVSTRTVSPSGTISAGSVSVSGMMKNMGSTTITSMDINYTVNGGAPTTQNLTGLSIGSGDWYNYSFSTPFTATGGSTYDVCVYATNINGNSDQRTCNDEICESSLANLGVSGNKNVLIEEFTGAWCGWCPDGAVVLENILDANPGRTFGVSIHNGDAMAFSDGIASGFNVTGYPNGMVDRVLFAGESKEPHSRGAWSANTTSQLSAYTPVDVSITANGWNSTTREISITAEANFVDYAAGDIRFVFYVVEDSVTGSGSGYDQVNYLNGTAGHPYFGAGDPIVGFVHRHVLRALPSGAYGNTGVIPSNVSPSSTYSESFTYTLPASNDENRISILAAVAYKGSSLGESYVLNVTGEHLNLGSVANDVAAGDNWVNVYPNPMAGQGVLKVNFTQPTHAVVSVYNTFGQHIANITERDFSAGESTVALDLSDLTTGVYLVNVKTDAGTFTKKIVLTK